MKTVLVYSGGLDSTVLLYDLSRNYGDEVRAISLDYGQRHRKELDSARRLAAGLSVPHRVLDLGVLRELLAGSSQTSDDHDVPEGHYAEESMKQTVVPNRNAILLSIAAGWAISMRYDRIAYAAHGGDHAIYPDCRPEFVASMNMTLAMADWHKIEIFAPYLRLGKHDLVKRGTDLGVPFRQTWSCYKGQAQHCGRCGTCVERQEAFQLARVPDPTCYVHDLQAV